MSVESFRKICLDSEKRLVKAFLQLMSSKKKTAEELPEIAKEVRRAIQVYQRRKKAIGDAKTLREIVKGCHLE